MGGSDKAGWGGEAGAGGEVSLTGSSVRTCGGSSCGWDGAAGWVALKGSS